MRTRILGKNGPEITVIGLGTWAIGGPWQFGWGPQDDNASIQAIQAALDSGINWIDTAAVYGFGHSEKIVGKAVKGRRDKVFLASKCGRTWDDQGNNYNNLRPESMRKEIDDTLKRLDVDYLDLYQIHWPDIATGTPLEDSWGVMKEIKDSGKARFIGVSNFNIEQLETCMKIEQVQSLQPPFNMIRNDVAKALLPWCEKNGVGVVAYSPMQSGLLTGKFDLNRLAEDDWRRNSLIFQEPNLSNNLQLVENLRPIAEKYNKTVGQLAVAWVLSNSAITAAIVGARNEAQATQNIEGDFIIEDDDLKKIRELLDNMPETKVGRI